MFKAEEENRKKFEPLDYRLEQIGEMIVNAAFTVHKKLGPGLLEKIYEVCLCYELRKLGLKTDRQIDMPIVYDEITFDEGLRLDILVEDKVIVEIKAVDQIIQFGRHKY
jgi:GxxExxY protein